MDQNSIEQQLADIRSQYNRATRLLRNVEVFGIEEFAKQFKEWKEKLLDDEEGVEAIWWKINDLVTEVENNKDHSEQVIDKIKTHLQEVDTYVNEMQEDYENFMKIKDNIEQTNTKIEDIDNEIWKKSKMQKTNYKK